MTSPTTAPDVSHPSIIHGPPLSDEPGLGPLTIGAYAREVTRRFSGREAVVLHGRDGRIAWTYDQLWDQSVAVAKALIAAGAGKDTRVGVLMTNRPEYLATVFGVGLAGAVTVSLSTFSTPEELEYLLKAGAVSILLYDRQVLKKDFGAILLGLEPEIATAPPGALLSTRLPFLRRLVALDNVTGPDTVADAAAVESWTAFLDRGRSVSDAMVQARADAVQPADTGAIFFSSGTTSLPKGIIHTHRAFTVQWWRWPRVMDIDADYFPVRCWTGNGFFWSGIISMVVGNALTTGGTAVLQPVFNADQALALMQAERVSFPMGRPHQWARLEASPKWPDVNLSSLHYVTYGSKLLEHPTASTNWRHCPAFGTTETLTIMAAVTANTPREIYRGSFGKPLPGNILKIFNPRTGEVVPIGQRGEIAIKGPTLMLGYIGKTADQCFDAEGFYCTGDGGYVDADGYLFWEGRLTDMIKTGGANVAPQEVDELLANYPGVKRAQTVGVPHDTLGELVVSCIIPHDGAALDIAEITGFLKLRLASFKVPRAILFFEEQEWAVTGSEKVKTGLLKGLAAQRLAGSEVMRKV